MPRVEPARGKVGQIGAPSDLVQTSGGGRIERVVPAQDVGDLAEQQARLVPVDRQPIEVDERLAAGQARGHLLGRQHRRRRDARLNATQRVDQLDLQRGRGRQLRLPLGEGSQLNDLLRVEAAPLRWTRHS